MIALAPEDLADLRRWALSGAVVVAAYGGIATAMVTWHDPISDAESAGAIVIEFAPELVGPPPQQTDLAPGPEMVMSDASPSKPVDTTEEKPEEKVEQKVEAKLEQEVEEQVPSKPVDEPPPEVSPAPNPEVAVEPPPPKQEVKQETPQRQTPTLPAPATTAPNFVPEHTAALPAAPTQSQLNPVKSAAAQKWNMQVFTLLKRSLRYPSVAQSRGQSGTVQIVFALDRKGNVLDSRVVRSSGVAALDEEALALLRRAQPFPIPPPEFPGERVNLAAPITFNLK